MAIKSRERLPNVTNVADVPSQMLFVLSPAEGVRYPTPAHIAADLVEQYEARTETTGMIHVVVVIWEAGHWHRVGIISYLDTQFGRNVAITDLENDLGLSLVWQAIEYFGIEGFGD
jgi:hypothetical protein